MSTIKEFLVTLGFKVDSSSLGKFKANLEQASKIASSVGAAATAAKGLITKFVIDTAKGFNQIELLSERVNASAKEISQLGFVASLTGSSVEAVASSLDRFNRTAGEAALGIGRGATAFKDLRLSAKKSNGTLKSTAELMEEVGDKIRGISAQKQVAMLERLGIDPTLVKALSGDVRGLKEEFNTMFRGAGINANAAAKASMNFIDSLTRMKFAFKTVKDAVLLRVMPKIKEGIDEFRKFLINNAPKIIQALTPIVDKLLDIGSAFINAAGKILLIAVKIIEKFTVLNDKTSGWAANILIAAVAWKVLNKGFLASPIGRILALVAAIGLLIDDFIAFKLGGKHLIDWGNLFNDTLKKVIATLDILTEKLFGFFKASKQLSTATDTSSGAGGFAKTALSILKFVGIGPNLKVNDAQNTSGVQRNSQNISQQTKITVNGSDSPEATAKAISGEQSRVNADMARNMSGALR